MALVKVKSKSKFTWCNVMNDDIEDTLIRVEFYLITDKLENKLFSIIKISSKSKTF